MPTQSHSGVIEVSNALAFVNFNNEIRGDPQSTVLYVDFLLDNN